MTFINISKYPIQNTKYSAYLTIRERDRELLEIVDVLSMFDLDFLGMEKIFLNKNHNYLSRSKKVAS
jgi:hypothetical protein